MGLSEPHEASSRLDAGPQEPERLVIPAEAVAYLLHLVIQDQRGNAWWNGFVTAKGVPSWIAAGQFQFVPRDVEVVRVQRTNGPAR